jgi:hypothetical protein
VLALVLAWLPPAGAAQAAEPARALRACPELESRTGVVTAGACYSGVPCVIGLRGAGLESSRSALAIAPDNSVVAAGLLATGSGEPGSARLCLPPAQAGAEGYASIRVPAPHLAGRHQLRIQRPRLFGMVADTEDFVFQVEPSHGFLDPRQSAATESVRAGETRVLTFSGRGLGALRLRGDSPLLRVPAGTPAAEVLWLDPGQTQVRVRLTLQQRGVVSTRDLFTFIGAGESEINRRYGWPVIQVR